MHKLMICILIAALYTTSLEAVADCHDHAGGDAQTVLLDHGDHDPGADHCDHCCHMASHLLGIIATVSTGAASQPSSIDIQTPGGARGRAAEPPTPPPNI